MIHFENQERREARIRAFLAEYGIAGPEEARRICLDAGIDPETLVREIQPICFSDAPWAFTVGCAAALENGQADTDTVTSILGDGLQSFCLPGSIAEERRIGEGHGRLAARLLSDETRCMAFVAGHESFAAAEGALGIVRYANKVRRLPLRVILNGLGKDAAEIIARFNGFTYVATRYDFAADTIEVTQERAFSASPRAAVRCYGANEMREGVAIMRLEQVDVSITGNGTNMIKFQHPVCGAYKKWCNDNGREYFACASGGGIGRTLNNDDISAGPASYGYTDMVSRTYADATFAGSSSVPAHVEMMGFIGMGNNPLVGAVVAAAVLVSEHLAEKQKGG